jgi:UPF0271 protein
VQTGKVEALDGSLVELDAESLCIHGDGPNSVEVARAIQRTLQDIGCEIKPVLQ